MNNYLLFVALVVAILLVLVLYIWKRKSGKPSSASLEAESLTWSDEKRLAKDKEVELNPVLQAELVAEVSDIEVVEGQRVFIDLEKEQEFEVEVSHDDQQIEDIEIEETATGEGEDDDSVVSSSEFLSREAYERWLLDLKEHRLAALTTAPDDNDELGQEQHQLELVAITEALSFSKQAYADNISCRQQVLVFLEEIKAGLSVMEYDMARKWICEEGDTSSVEQLFDTIAGREDAVAPLALYHGGRLAEQRIDFQKSMKNYGKAVDGDRNNPDFIRSAGLLSLRLYLYQEAQGYFSSLVGFFEKNNPDSVELALARRDYAYALAMVGRSKEAGTLYRQAMQSLTQLLDGDDPEIALC